MANKKVQIDKVKNIKRDANIIEIQGALSRHPEITSPMIGAFGAQDIADSNLGIGFAYIHEPLVGDRCCP